jgi:hypothetical protein
MMIMRSECQHVHVLVEAAEADANVVHGARVRNDMAITGMAKFVAHDSRRVLVREIVEDVLPDI